MRATMEPTNYVLKRRIPSTEDWLGRIVQYYQDPTASFVSPSVESGEASASPTKILTTTETDFHLNVHASKESSIKSQLTQLLKIGNTTTISDVLELSTPRITYRRLASHRDVFDRVRAQPGIAKRLLEMVPVGHKAYMIIGLVQIEAGSSIRRSKTTSKSSERGLGLPVVEVATAAAGIPLSLGGIADIELEEERTKSHMTETRGLSDKASEIIAVEYRAIRRNFSGLGRKVVLRDSIVDFQGALTFQQGGDEDSDDSSDDEDCGVDGFEFVEGGEPVGSPGFEDLFTPRTAGSA